MSEDNSGALPCAEKMVFDDQKQAESTALAADWQHGGEPKGVPLPLLPPLAFVEPTNRLVYTCR